MGGPRDRSPGTGGQAIEYRSILDGHFIEGANEIQWAATDASPAFVHRDLMILSFDPHTAELKMRGFYSEGLVHDDRYVEAGDTRLVFETPQVEGGPPGMRARNTITFVGANALEVTFELAMPGSGFEPYTHESLRREGLTQG